jgi:hypothetical protein
MTEGVQTGFEGVERARGTRIDQPDPGRTFEYTRRDDLAVPLELQIDRFHS